MDRFPIELDAPVPSGATNAYLVGAPDRLLVDPAGRTDALDRAVAEAEIDHVAVTHAHPDHVDAFDHYADETNATVWARYGRADAFERATGLAPDRTFRGGTTIPGTGITVCDTPGHAPDHVAFVRDGEAAIGDLAFAEGSVFVGDDGGDVRAYLTSLRRLRGRDFDRLHPGHGDPIERPADRLETLLAHRLDREHHVLEAVRNGAETPEEIVDEAYDRELGSLRPLAVRTVRAHLQKLAVEQKVDWDGERAVPV